MTMLAPTLQSFFTSYLVGQRDAGANTIIAYRDTWRLLLVYLRDVHHLAPERVDFEDLSSETIVAFLAYLEATRANSASTRNARLAAVHALFHHAALHLPEHASTIARVLAIAPKRTATPDVSYLSESEVSALLTAPMLGQWAGRRDQLMVLTLVSTGLRVSELTAATWADVALGTPAYLCCHGKGRKDRCHRASSRSMALQRELLVIECVALHEAAQAKTLAHELGHVMLHGPESTVSRDIGEVEAESVAFVLGARFGLDTSDYSLDCQVTYSQHLFTLQPQRFLSCRLARGSRYKALSSGARDRLVNRTKYLPSREVRNVRCVTAVACATHVG